MTTLPNQRVMAAGAGWLEVDVTVVTVKPSTRQSESGDRQDEPGSGQATSTARTGTRRRNGAGRP